MNTWLLRYVVLGIVGVLPALAERPACVAANRGQLWKAPENGEVFLCTATVWRHRWQPLTVHVSRLGKPERPAATTPEPKPEPTRIASRD